VFPTLFVDARALTTPLTPGRGSNSFWDRVGRPISSSVGARGGLRSHHSAPIVHSLSKLYMLKSNRDDNARSLDTLAVYAAEMCPSIGLNRAVMVVGGDL
jgi:hypothetical protein